MDERDVQRGAGVGEVRGAVPVRGEGCARVRLRAVDRRERGSVDDERGAVRRERGVDGVGIGDIELGAREADDARAACRADPEQLAADLPARAGDQDHDVKRGRAAARSSSASVRPAASLSESAGSRSMGQSMPMAGSDQSSTRSCSGW